MDKITHKVRCEQWTSIIKECLASGMPKTTWCREHGISDKAFFTGNEFSEKKHIQAIKVRLKPSTIIIRQKALLKH